MESSNRQVWTVPELKGFQAISDAEGGTYAYAQTEVEVSGPSGPT